MLWMNANASLRKLGTGNAAMLALSCNTKAFDLLSVLRDARALQR
jgi:hypothetical protein